MTVRQLQQEIRSGAPSMRRRGSLRHRHFGARGARICGSSLPESASNEDAGEAARPEFRPDATASCFAVASLPTSSRRHAPGTHEIHEIAKDWLDIDSGIYVDVGQHDAGSDPE